MNTVSVNVPEMATKQLSMRHVNDKRRITISSNWLLLFGFSKGMQVVERSLGHGLGIEIVPAERGLFDDGLKPKKVYSRTYKARKNNPFETLMEVSSQRLIEQSFGQCTRVHVQFTHERIMITPLTTHKEAVLANLDKKSALRAAFACSGGVDAKVFSGEGFEIPTLIEYRPNEKRDNNTDKTEVTSINAIANLSIGQVFNEDISQIDIARLSDAITNNPSIFHCSLPCTEFSNVKAQSLKEKSRQEQNSSIDLCFDYLRILEALKPAVSVIENVEGFFKSDAYKIIEARMGRWGYHANLEIADARDHGGLTSRKRGFAVFSIWNDFSFTPLSERNTIPVLSLIDDLLHQCRDVTHSKSLQDGLALGRLRLIEGDKPFSPTILRSQPKVCKDSCVIRVNDRLYWPSEAVLKRLMGISKKFTLNAVSGEEGQFVVGQSVDCAHHKAIAQAVKAHISKHMKIY